MARVFKTTVQLDSGLLISPSTLAGSPTAGKVWTASDIAGNGSWQSPTVGAGPSARVRRDTAQAIPVTTLTPISFNAADHQVNGTLWSAGAPTRLTAPVAGVYVFTGTCRFSGAAGSAGGLERDLIAIKNGNIGVYHGWTQNYPASGIPTVLTVAGQVQMAAGDFLEMVVYTGTALSTDSTGFQPHFEMGLSSPAAPGVWTTLTPEAGWQPLSPSTEFGPIQYRKVGDVVEVRGLIQRTGSTAPAGGESVMLTLPPDFRPPSVPKARERFTCTIDDARLSYIDVYASTGQVRVGTFTGAIPSGSYVTITNVRFSTVA